MSDDAQDGVSRRTAFQAAEATAGAYSATTGTNTLREVINNAGRQITRLGTIEVGELGDRVVLIPDYFTSPRRTCARCGPVPTALGGQVVHT